jgi:16S rRNA (guanine527-N7)-methyltransferase
MSLEPPPALLPARSLSVSRETERLFTIFEQEFRRWNARINLAAQSTLERFRTRHVEDSLQVAAHAGNARVIVDLGSGGGLPGLVTAIALRDTPGLDVHLIEAVGKKCAFLRHVARELRLPVTVHQARIEAVIERLPQADLVTARALASLDTLVALAEPHMRCGARALFHKGREWREELRLAGGLPGHDLLVHASPVDADSVLLELRAKNPRRPVPPSAEPS